MNDSTISDSVIEAVRMALSLEQAKRENLKSVHYTLNAKKFRVRKKHFDLLDREAKKIYEERRKQS